MSNKEGRTILQASRIASDNTQSLAQQNGQEYGQSNKQQYENLDYEEFYGPDAYLGAWHPLATEEHYEKLGYLSSIKNFARNLLNQKWELREKQIESGLSSIWASLFRPASY